jgi:hypothetical protein
MISSDYPPLHSYEKSGWRVMKRVNALLLVICFQFLIPAPEAGSDNDSMENAIRQKLQRPYFAMSYGPEFARRFSLPMDRAVKLSEGMFAIAFEIKPCFNDYEELVHLFLDDRLRIDYPQDCGDFNEKSMAEHFVIKEYTERDFRYHMELITKSFMKIIVRGVSLDNGEQGFISSLAYTSVKRNVFPGITLASMTGLISESLDSKYGRAEILLQKEGVGDYVLIYDREINSNFDKIHRFEIPENLQKHIHGYLDFIAVEYIRNKPGFPEPDIECI